jgi:Periplasmic copper-binding protein (NosD)
VTTNAHARAALALALAAVLAGPGPAQARIYFVSPRGDDRAAGSAAAPWKTLQHAAGRVAAGDTVVVRAGTYAGFDLRTSGTAGKPITFRTEGEVVIGTRNPKTPDGINLEGAGHVALEGFKVLNNSGSIPRAGIRIVNADHVGIRKNTIDHCGSWGILAGFANDLVVENNVTSRSEREHGIYVGNSANRPVIRGNRSWGNNVCGIHINADKSAGGDGIITGALVENNVIFGNGKKGGGGINCDGVQGSRIQNNLLYDNHSSGITLYRDCGGGPSKDNVVVNNTVIMARDARWALSIQNGSTGNTVLNNILYNHHAFRGSMDISPDSLPGLESDHNVVVDRFTMNGGDTIFRLAEWRSRTDRDNKSLLGTPAALFCNPMAGDYRPAPGSPTIDAGTSMKAPDRDIEGNRRPRGKAVDIGAYESEGAAQRREALAAPELNRADKAEEVPAKSSAPEVPPPPMKGELPSVPTPPAPIASGWSKASVILVMVCLSGVLLAVGIALLRRQRRPTRPVAP